MLEEQLKQLFKQVAVENPVPCSVTYGERVRVVVHARQARRWVAAVVAGLITVAGFSAPGRSLVQAAIGLFSVNMHTRVVPMSEEEKARMVAHVPNPATSWSYDSVNVHETRDISFSTKVGTHKALLWAVTVGELRKEKATWPLPQYLPPYNETKVVIREDYYPGSNTRITGANAWLEYNVALKGRVYHVSYQTFRSEKPYPVPEDPRIWEADPDAFEQQTVAVNGHEATAVRYRQSDTWTLRAFYTTGYLHLSSNLPLNELVKVAASISVLQRN